MKSRISLILLIILTMTACSKRKIFEERHTFKNLKWNAFESVFFETDIRDIEQDYDISVEIRHHTLFPYPNLSMNLAIYSPSGERRLIDISLQLKDENGNFRASGMGDLWDLTEPVLKQFRFNEAGHYKFELENMMSNYDTPGLMEVGLKIEKSSK